MSTSGTLFGAGLLIIGVAVLAPGLDSFGPPPPSAEPRAESGDAPTPSLAPMQAQVGNGFVSQELVRSPDGHFYADATVNGAQVRFMIDTGASFVALTREDAQRAGIFLGSDRMEAIGAGGAFEVTPVTIQRISLGALSATDVQGAVADELNVSLLGQSFLERVGSVEIRGDRMVLR